MGNDELIFAADDTSTYVTVENNPSVAGGDRILTDGFAPVEITNVDNLTIYSGTGDETITLNELDTATALRTIRLSGDTQAGSGAGNDTFMITPSTVAVVYLTGGDGTDTMSLAASGNAVTGDRQSLQLDGFEPVHHASIERIDLYGDASNDDFSLMPSPTAEIHAHGDAGTDTLTVIAPPLLATDTGTYIEVCGHERLYYDGFESVIVQAPLGADVLAVVASGGEDIAIADAPGSLLTNQAQHDGFGLVQFTGIQTLDVTLDPVGNTVDLQLLDACAWLSRINLNGAAGDDVFLIEPAFLAEVHVEGNEGTDSLTVDALGRVAVDRGTHIEVSGYQNIYYSGIETVVLTNVALGTIVVRKQTPDGLGSGFAFTDTIALPNAFTLNAGETTTFSDVAPGAYTVTEADPGPSHVLTGILVDDEASDVPSTVDVGSRTATIHVESGETVTVSFVNALNAYGRGDVDGDGAVTFLDARICLQIARGVTTASPEAHAAADVNEDGVVDEIDAEILAEYVIRMRLTLP